MANLTLAIDDDILRSARIRALQQGTSVNAVVREFLVRYAQAGRPQDALRKVVEIAESVDAGAASGGRSWARDDLYTDRTAWPPSSTRT